MTVTLSLQHAHPRGAAGAHEQPEEPPTTAVIMPMGRSAMGTAVQGVVGAGEQAHPPRMLVIMRGRCAGPMIMRIRWGTTKAHERDDAGERDSRADEATVTITTMRQHLDAHTEVAGGALAEGKIEALRDEEQSREPAQRAGDELRCFARGPR